MTDGVPGYLVTPNKTPGVVGDFSTPPRNVPKDDYNRRDLSNRIPTKVTGMFILFYVSKTKNACLFKTLSFQKYIEPQKDLKFHKVEII